MNRLKEKFTRWYLKRWDIRYYCDEMLLGVPIYDGFTFECPLWVKPFAYALFSICVCDRVLGEHCVEGFVRGLKMRNPHVEKAMREIIERESKKYGALGGMGDTQ